MCLKKYLRYHHMTPKQFAEWLKINPQTVWAWLRGTTPRHDMIERIFHYTRGEVGPQDWFSCTGESRDV